MSHHERPQHPPAALTPDPELGAVLRSLEGEPPLEAVNWEGLRRSVGARAELPLARRRHAKRQPAPQPSPSLGWRALIPLTAVASIALAVWLGGAGDPSEPGTIARPSAEEVFRHDLSEQEFHLLVSGHADPESLLLIALDES